MNHQKIHDAIISNALIRQLDPEVYFEKHHIIPRCEGGLEKGPTVKLLFKEHRIIHLLRWKITGINKHKHAYNLMKYGEKGRRMNASNAAKQVKNRGGIFSQDWRDLNSKLSKEIASKAGKIGGKITGSKLWWNNSIINKKSFECPGEGWVRGMLQSEKKIIANKTNMKKCNTSGANNWRNK